MCNLYSMTKNVDAIRRLFKVDPANDRTGNMPSLPGIYPDYPAPIVRSGSGGRELAMARWACRRRNGRCKKVPVWFAADESRQGPREHPSRDDCRGRRARPRRRPGPPGPGASTSRRRGSRGPAFQVFESLETGFQGFDFQGFDFKDSKSRTRSQGFDLRGFFRSQGFVRHGSVQSSVQSEAGAAGVGAVLRICGRPRWQPNP
jgi:hypothetical protein